MLIKEKKIRSSRLWHRAVW